MITPPVYFSLQEEGYIYMASQYADEFSQKKGGISILGVFLARRGLYIYVCHARMLTNFLKGISILGSQCVEGFSSLQEERGISIYGMPVC